MIDGIRRDTGHYVRVICSVLDVPRSSYYHAAAPTPTQRSDQEIGEVIEEIFKSHQGRYGHRRISAELSPCPYRMPSGRGLAMWMQP